MQREVGRLKIVLLNRQQNFLNNRKFSDAVCLFVVGRGVRTFLKNLTTVDPVPFVMFLNILHTRARLRSVSAIPTSKLFVLMVYSSWSLAFLPHAVISRQGALKLKPHTVQTFIVNNCSNLVANIVTSFVSLVYGLALIFVSSFILQD